MLTITKRMPQGRGLARALLARAPALEIDWDVRQKSRFDGVDSTGRALAVFLPRGSVVRGGDVLIAEDGSLVRIVAAPQAVLLVRAPSPQVLLRAAYHLGNRHVALEVAPDHLKLEPDHVLAQMLRSMGLEVTELRAPFEPEAGAYAGDKSHAHRGEGQRQDHGHGHGHEHQHEHHDHDHDHHGHRRHDHG
jgi:urease accessory protein